MDLERTDADGPDPETLADDLEQATQAASPHAIAQVAASEAAPSQQAQPTVSATTSVRPAPTAAEALDHSDLRRMRMFHRRRWRSRRRSSRRAAAPRWRSIRRRARGSSGVVKSGVPDQPRGSEAFRMPPEWAPHDAVWTAWPHDPAQWGEGLEAPRRALMQMIAAIVDLDPATGAPRGERVELLVRSDGDGDGDGGDEAAARALLGPAARGVRFRPARYGDVWLRDTGPIFLTRPGELAAARFQFDGWGGKYVMAGDTEVAATVAAWAGARGAAFDFVLEGGAIEVDGAGTLLTTRQCMIGGGRNPGLDERAIEARLRWALGVERIGWLDRGLHNDHTDGHVDTLARFVAPGVALCMEPAPGDPNRDALAGILGDLRAAGLEVVTVPSPGAVLDAAGSLLPASYMNFYLANTTVVVPTYGAPADDAAVAAIAALFPGRRAVAVDGKPVVVGGGAFHCSTQQQPSV